MSTQQQIIGNWGQLKSKVKQRWGQLTDDELQEVEGNYDQLLGLIQQKTGEAREQIERVLNELNGGTLSKAADSIRQYANQAGEAVRGAAGDARLRAEERYEEVQEIVREHPGQAIAVAFGIGVGVGLLLSIALHAPTSRPRSWHDRFVGEGLGRRLRQRAESLLPETVSERLGI